MDDAGEMSAWYVFTAFGLHPFSATDAECLVTATLFDEVNWRSGSGKITPLKKPGKGRALTSIKVNEKENKRYFVSQDLLKNGGKIEIITKRAYGSGSHFSYHFFFFISLKSSCKSRTAFASAFRSDCGSGNSLV